jgi:hemin uptake protein HemP
MTSDPPRTQDAKSSPQRANLSSAEPADRRVVASDEILQGRDEVQILHENQLYRLRRTRNGKLILHK